MANFLKNMFSKKEDNRKNSTLVTKRDIEEIINKKKKISGIELNNGFNLIKKYPRSVSILGSARFDKDNQYYKKAESLAFRISKELKYAVVTGGGPGIMEAANKGAYDAKGVSLGFSIKLPHEQTVNKYLTEYVEFEYFFSRKTLLFFAAEAYIYFPGGFGTFDELFEIITLIQTQKITKAPVILVGKEFWTPFLDLIKQKMVDENQTVKLSETEIYKVVDSEDEIIDIIRKAPYRED